MTIPASVQPLKTFLSAVFCGTKQGQARVSGDLKHLRVASGGCLVVLGGLPRTAEAQQRRSEVVMDPTVVWISLEDLAEFPDGGFQIAYGKAVAGGSDPGRVIPARLRWHDERGQQNCRDQASIHS